MLYIFVLSRGEGDEGYYDPYRNGQEDYPPQTMGSRTPSERSAHNSYRAPYVSKNSTLYLCRFSALDISIFSTFYGMPASNEMNTACDMLVLSQMHTYLQMMVILYIHV